MSFVMRAGWCLKMTKAKCLFVAFVFSAFYMLSAQANEQSVEAYIKIKPGVELDTENNLCSYIIQLLPISPSPHCRVIQLKQHIIQLNWVASSNTNLVNTLEQLKTAKQIEWFEIKGASLHLQSLDKTDLTLLLDASYWSGVPAFLSQKNDPWFISNDILKLRSWNYMLQVYGSLVVAVIDSGITFTEIPYAATKWKNNREIANNNIDDDANGYVDDINGWDFVAEGYQNIFEDTDIADADANDYLGHGTAVASIISAVVGEKFSPNIQLMPLRVAYGASGSGTINPSALAEAIYYAADNGANIINVSLGGEQTYQIIADAITYAQSKNIAVVAAAGNTGSSLIFPANQKGVLAVGALDRFGSVLASSAKGIDVDLFASGETMVSASNSSLLKNVHPSGTSFSAPFVTGVLALMSLASSGAEEHCVNQRNSYLKNIPLNAHLSDWISINLKNLERERNYSNSNEAWVQHSNNCGAPAATLSSLVRKI